MRANPSEQPRGNVMLLAVFMLATGIVGGLTVALIVVSQLRQAKSLDNALTAYYSAEAGLEQSLYDVRQSGYCAGASTCNDTTYISQNLPGASPTSCTAAVAGVGCTSQNYERQIIPAAVLAASRLNENDTFQLDLDGTNSVTQLTVLWYPAVTPPPSPLLEVSYLVSSGGATQVCRPNALNLFAPYPCVVQTGAGGVCYPDGSGPLVLPLSTDPTKTDCPAGAFFQQVRFKALVASISNLSIQATGGTGLSNYIEVHSRRTLNKSTQALQTTIPKSASAFGFPDYVIFSEQDISK